jgi:phospholipid/cholesterol/gamma-HCH transport system substrate-binding protein
MKGPIQGFRGHVATAVVCIAIGVAFLGVLLYYGGGLPTLSDDYEMQAILPTSAALAPGARVTMAGAEVGSVHSVKRQGLGSLVRLTIEDSEVAPVPKDSRVRLRAHTPVGENYVEVIVGRSKQMLGGGDTLPMTSADDYVDVDQILSILQGSARDRARRMLQGAGGALRGHGDELNALLGDTAGALETGSGVVKVLSDDRRQLSRLIQQLGDVSAAIGERGSAVRTLARQGRATAEAVAARDAALRNLVDELPRSLRQIRGTSRLVDTVSGQAAPVLADVAVAVRQIRPSVRRLQPAAHIGRGVVSELGAAAPRLEKTLAGLRRVAPPAAKALPSVKRVFCELNPVIRYLKPYTDDVISAVGGLGSAANSYDALGHVIRLTGIVSDNTLVAMPPEVTAAAQTLLHSGLLSKSNALNWNPYPKPGRIGKDSGVGKSVQGPQELGKTGYVYPRIGADC